MKQAIHLIILFAVLAFAGCDGGRRQQMEALLDRADSLNRAYVPMTGGLDSLLLEAARYYDRHGTANEQVRAHYLLGCAHRDMGEAPAALQCYQDAVDRADTLSPDCDYRRLMSVYGQMAELFDAQNLPEDEIDASKKYGQLALMAKDTLKYIRNKELLAKPYFLMGDTLRMLSILEEARRLYIQHGYEEQAYSLSLPIIHYLLEMGEDNKAREQMHDFETKSGLFDGAGEIAYGRETYYYIKGMLYLREGQTESAERSFRKLLCYQESADAYHGLQLVYQTKGIADSVMKFSLEYAGAIHKWHDTRKTEAIHQMAALYNYHRFLQKAQAEELAASRTMLIAVASAIVFVVILCILIYTYHSARKRQKANTENLLRQYEQEQAYCSKLSGELLLLKENSLRLRLIKEAELEELKTQLLDYEAQLQARGFHDNPAFINSDIVNAFHRKAKRKLHESLPSSSEWRDFMKKFKHNMPLASAILLTGAPLSTNEQYIVVLHFLGFTNDEIVSLLDSSPQSVSNIKLRINMKLFDESTSTTLAANIRRKYEGMAAK